MNRKLICMCYYLPQEIHGRLDNPCVSVPVYLFPCAWLLQLELDLRILRLRSEIFHLSQSLALRVEHCPRSSDTRLLP